MQQLSRGFTKRTQRHRKQPKKKTCQRSDRSCFNDEIPYYRALRLLRSQIGIMSVNYMKMIMTRWIVILYCLKFSFFWLHMYTECQKLRIKRDRNSPSAVHH